MIGNYGIHPKASNQPLCGLEALLSDKPWQSDHRNSRCSVGELLAAHGVPGIQAIDTRAITRRVREQVRFCVYLVLWTRDILARLSELTSPELEDLVDLVSMDEMILLNQGAVDDLGSPLPRLAAIDCGIKYNILPTIRSALPQILPSEVQRMGASALFCSNGPGDPAHRWKPTKMCIAEAIKTSFQ